MSDPKTSEPAPEGLAKALKLAGQIDAKAAHALDTLAREMTIMKWEPAFRAILWETVARKAMARAKEAKDARA